jgi:hypothetical protein
MSTKLLFLDFDGVLNSTHYLNSPSFMEETKDLSDAEIYLVQYQYMIDPEAVRLVNQIVEASQVQVIISSSHRTRYSIGELEEILKSRGAIFPVAGKIPRIHWVPRGVEIQAFLDGLPQPPDSFVIIDDHYDMVHLKDYLVATTMETGLRPDHVSLVLRILKGKLS